MQSQSFMSMLIQVGTFNNHLPVSPSGYTT